MKTTTLPLLGLLALLTASCGKKASGGASEENKNEPLVLSQKNSMPAAGTVVIKENAMVMTDAALKVKAGGQEMDGTMSQTQVGKEKQEILSPDKFRRTLLSKSSIGKMKLNGADQPTPEKADPLLGVPVIVERRNGKWLASMEDGSAPGLEQKDSLDKVAKGIQTDSDFAMYGDTPRKPGDKWEVDPAKLSTFGDAEKLTGSFTMEFLEIKDVSGTRCAVLKGVFDIRGKTEAESGAPQLDIRLKGEALSHRSIADQIDLDAEINATATVSGSPAAHVTMQVEGPTRITEKTSVKKP